MISKAQLKKYRSLRLKKYRAIHRQFLVEGFNLCVAALQNNAKIEVILTSHECNTNPSFAKIQTMAASRSIPVEMISHEAVIALSDSESPQGVFSIISMTTLKSVEFWMSEYPVVLLLHQIRDPGNLGTILRTASWFGIPAVLLSGQCVDLYNAKVLRSTAGAIFELNIFEHVEVPEFVSQVTKSNYKMIVTSPNAAVEYTEVDFEPPFILIIGNERSGVDEQTRAIADSEICIPRKGQGDSLNAAVSAGILLSEIYRNN